MPYILQKRYRQGAGRNIISRRMPYVGTRFIASARKHWGFHSMYIPADAMLCGSTCDNDIAILTQFAFGGKMLYLCNGRQGRPRRFALFSSKTAGLIVFFRLGKGKITWLVVFSGCHVGIFRCHVVFRRSHVGKLQARLRTSGLCTKVKNVNVGKRLCGTYDGRHRTNASARCL